MAVMISFFLILLMLLLRSALDKKQIRAKYKCVEIFKYVKLKGNSICWLNLKTSDYLTKNTFSEISKWIQLRFELIPSCAVYYIFQLYASTILNKTFIDFFTFQHSFFSPQAKRKQIIITKKWMYELSHELLNVIW